MQTKFIFISLMAIAASPVFAQTEDKRDPSVTEIWEPKPKKVTPGMAVGEAPSDATVLFDGKDLNQWVAEGGTAAKWDLKEGFMTVSKGYIQTKQQFGDFQLHIEWRAPSVVTGEGQGRGNSGIFLQERYELQVLDSYESVTYSNGQAGSIYKQTMPLVNVTRKPGEWQAYDVIYTAPHFGQTGAVVTPAHITVLHNGVVIQNNTTIWGSTQYKGLASYESHGKGALRLQDHGNPVSYRNIWIREL